MNHAPTLTATQYSLNTVVPCVVALLCALAAGCASTQLLFDKGLDALDNGKYAAAIRYYTRAIATDSTWPMSFNNRAVAYYFTLDTARALADVNQAITLDSTLIIAYFNRALFYSHMTRNREAIDDYTRIIRLKPTSSRAYTNRGYTYYRLGMDDSARADFDRILRDLPDYFYAHHGKGLLFYRHRLYDSALVCYERAISTLYNHIMYIRQVPLNRKTADQRRRIEYMVEERLERYQRNMADFFFDRAAVYAQISDAESALADYHEGLRWDSTRVSVYEKIGLLYYNTGNLDRSIDWLHKAALHQAASTRSRYTLALCYFQQGNDARAEQEYRKALNNSGLAPVHSKNGTLQNNHSCNCSTINEMERSTAVSRLCSFIEHNIYPEQARRILTDVFGVEP